MDERLAPLPGKDIKLRKDGKGRPNGDVLKAFIARMTRDGRDMEWYKRIREAIASSGKRFGAVKWQVARDMGYTDGKTEWKLDEDFRNNIHKTSAEREAELKKVHEERLHALTDFEKACATLPPNAPPDQEIAWIRSHPAMSRLNRTDHDKGSRGIRLTLDDVLRAPHGKAPSQAAVHQLQHWANVPAKFFEMCLSEDKKKMEEVEAEKAAMKDMGLAEVERLLREVGGQ